MKKEIKSGDTVTHSYNERLGKGVVLDVFKSGEDVGCLVFWENATTMYGPDPCKLVHPLENVFLVEE